MMKKGRMMKLLQKLGIVLALATLAACGKTDSKELVWYEEALQDDGSIVLVKKMEAGYSITGKEPGAGTYGYRPLKMEVTDPKTGKPVLWSPRGLPPLMPYALHVHEKVLYVFSIPYLFDGHAQFGCQRPPYILFRWEGDRWKRIGLAELPKRFKRHNLLDSAAYRLHEDGTWFFITPERLVKAGTIEMHVRLIGGNPRAFNPRPSDLYEREIQYADLGPYYECSKFNLPTKYDHV
jgi:hypothetical protein